jgi:hypothetical protein
VYGHVHDAFVHFASQESEFLGDLIAALDDVLRLCRFIHLVPVDSLIDRQPNAAIYDPFARRNQQRTARLLSDDVFSSGTHT